MPGSPKKRARRGNAGNPVDPGARARAERPWEQPIVPVTPESLPDADGLALRGVCALVAVIESGTDARAMVSAASKLLDFFPPDFLRGARRRRTPRELLQALRDALPALEREVEAEEASAGARGLDCSLVASTEHKEP